jgi:hypothetical protein
MQLALFNALHESSSRSERLYRVLDEVARYFGENAVMRGLVQAARAAPTRRLKYGWRQITSKTITDKKRFTEIVELARLMRSWGKTPRMVCNYAPRIIQRCWEYGAIYGNSAVYEIHYVKRGERLRVSAK